MERWVVLLAIGLFLVGFIAADSITGNPIENNTGATVGSSCIDLDHGKNYEILGTAKNGTDIQTDSCTYCTGACAEGASCPAATCGAVVEFYCDGNAIKSETHVCGENKVCENGACVDNPIIVGDTCGDVAPENRNHCCAERGYASWNADIGKCINLSINKEEPATEPFCGKSTLGLCQTDEDCIKGGCSGQVCQAKGEEQAATTCEYRNCYAPAAYHVNCLCIENKCKWSKLTEIEIHKITTAKNVVSHIEGGCPESCTCTGSAMKCTLANGRVMTIFAGKSGNVIVQVKGENMTTNVTLYKEEGKLYGVFRNNETKEVRLLPDQVKERIKEKLEKQFENENISLDDNGTYQYQGEKRARLFFIIPVRVMVRAEIDPTTGEIIKLKTGKWWSFLAKDENNRQVVGSSCATVTPGQNNACCQTKGFDFWNNATNLCEFSQ